MGRMPVDKERRVDDELQSKWVSLLIPFLQKNGLRNTTMDEVARVIGVSKATLYKYFSSRDEIFSLVVDSFLSGLDLMREVLFDESLSFEERYIRYFENLAFQSVDVSTTLLEDIKYHFPRLSRRIEQSQTENEFEFQKFYSRGVEAGAFMKIHPSIVARISRVALDEFLDPDFLLRNGLSFQQALKDFYMLKTQGTLNPESSTALSADYLDKRLVNMFRGTAGAFVTSE